MKPSRRPSVRRSVEFKWVCAAAALAALAGSAALASDLIPLRPALDDAQVLLYDGQQTALGTIAINGGTSFSLGRDGATYVNVFLNRGQSGVVSAILRVPRGSTTPELVIASGGTTTTGEAIVAVGAFALLPSSGPVAITAEILVPGESANRLAILRVDAPDFATVLLREGDPAPPPLTGVFFDLPLQRPFNAFSDTHMVSAAFLEQIDFNDTSAICRLSLNGQLDVLVASGLEDVERLGILPRVGPTEEVVYAMSPTSSQPGGVVGDERIETRLERVDAAGIRSTLVRTGDPVSGTPRPSDVGSLRVTFSSPPLLPDAHHIGAQGEVYVSAFLETDLSLSNAPTALLRIDDSGARTILLDTDVDPCGGANIVPINYAFRDGAVVGVFFQDSQRPRELWYADGVARRRLLPPAEPVPGFAPGSVLGVDLFPFGSAHYDLDRERIVFFAPVIEPGGASNQRGIFTVSEFGSVELLARTGDALAIGAEAPEIRGFARFGPHLQFKTDDSSGQSLLGVQLDNGSSAVLRLQRAVSTDADTTSPCAGDLTRDRRVDVADLHAALTSSPVDVADLNLVLSAFGSTCD